jgi:16S rRNA (adenine1518-N6/adenine1519-N6)-dimethyltransferase
MNYNSIREIQQLLEDRNLSLKKRWGQNFLISPQIKQRIITVLNPGADDTVWEIGPGIGSMSILLADRVADLTLFEIDHGLVRLLNEQFGPSSGVRIVDGDFLKTWQPIRDQKGLPDKLVGNLPYSSGSAMIVDLIKHGGIPGKMVFLLQREVAERMTAGPGSKDYSFFSVICAGALDIQVRGRVNPGAFYPRPEVVSELVECTPSMLYGQIADRGLFLLLIKTLFSSRRKTVKNNLFNGPTAPRFGEQFLLDVLQQCGIDPEIRAEKLPVEVLIRLANTLSRSESAC